MPGHLDDAIDEFEREQADEADAATGTPAPGSSGAFGTGLTLEELAAGGGRPGPPAAG